MGEIETLPDASLITTEPGLNGRSEGSGRTGGPVSPDARHIRGLFPTRAAALGAGRELLRQRQAADVSISAHPDDASLGVIVAEAQEGPALYIMYRWGAEIEFDVPLAAD
ncbi:MAG: hypothetical protein ACP5VP_03800 [Candidatus Limnocylindrales bacterium]